MSWFGSLGARAQQLLERRAAVIGINRRNLQLVYPHNDRRDYPVADDKLLTKQVLANAGVPIPETLAVCDGLYAVEPALEVASGLENFVVKPAAASGGDGILVVGEAIGPDAWRLPGGERLGTDVLRRHLADIVFGAYSKQLDDRAFLERRVMPHAMFDGLWREGLSDLRVITLDARPVMSMIRVPTERSGGRANLHQGGLGLAVDLATGKTARAMVAGRLIERHPETGADLLGLQVPDWSAVMEVVHATARAVPLGYLGIDLVVDRELGPLVLEINARPGLEIQNVNGLGLATAIEREDA